jgi:amino acid permease
MQMFFLQRYVVFALLLYFSIKTKTNKQQLKKAMLKTNKRYQNLKNNKQKSENKIQRAKNIVSNV